MPQLEAEAADHALLVVSHAVPVITGDSEAADPLPGAVSHPPVETGDSETRHVTADSLVPHVIRD